MKKLLKFTLLLWVFLATLSAHAAGYDPQVCRQTLSARGMQPACSSSDLACPSDSPAIHQLCAQQASHYFPAQLMECKNKKTNETKSFPSDQIFQKCNELQKTDPNWEIQSCYCCCP